MKVLLQKIGSSLFLRKSGDWTANAKEAQCFANTLEALRFWRDNGLPAAKVVLRFEDLQDRLEVAQCVERQPEH